MQDAILLDSGEHGPEDVLAHTERRLQCDRAGHIGVAAQLGERSNGELGVVLISDRNALPLQLASSRTRGANHDSQLAAGIHLARRDVDRAYALSMYLHVFATVAVDAVDVIAALSQTDLS
jgi:hypothetical protein